MTAIVNPNKVRPLMDAQASQLVSHITLGDSNSERSRGWPHGIQWALLQHYGETTMYGSGMFSFNERLIANRVYVGYSFANTDHDIHADHQRTYAVHPMPDELRAFWDPTLDPAWGVSVNHLQPYWRTLADRSIPIGDVTDGPYKYGETITQTTSGATGVFRYISDGVMYFTYTAGTFDGTNVLTGGTSGATTTPTNTPTTITPSAYAFPEPGIVVKTASNYVGWPTTATGDNVAWRVWAGVFADNDFDAAAAPGFGWIRSYIQTIQQQAFSGAGLTSFKASDFGLSATQLRPDPYQFDMSGYTQAGGSLVLYEVATAPKYPQALYWHEYINLDKTAGFSLSQLYDRSGANASDAHAYLTALGDTRIGHWLASVGHRANELDQAPKAVVWVNFGVNDAGDDVTKADYKTAVEGIVARMKAAWASAGWAAADIGFILMPSHPLATDTAEEALQVQYRAACVEIALADPQVMAVDLTGLTTTTELSSLATMPAYDGVADEDHLEENNSDDDNSYSVLALRALEAAEAATSVSQGIGRRSHIILFKLLKLLK